MGLLRCLDNMYTYQTLGSHPRFYLVARNDRQGHRFEGGHIHLLPTQRIRFGLPYHCYQSATGKQWPALSLVDSTVGGTVLRQSCILSHAKSSSYGTGSNLPQHDMPLFRRTTRMCSQTASYRIVSDGKSTDTLVMVSEYTGFPCLHHPSSWASLPNSTTQYDRPVFIGCNLRFHVPNNRWLVTYLWSVDVPHMSILIDFEQEHIEETVSV